jgi:hypothetical protein
VNALLADAILVVHFLFVAFVVGGLAPIWMARRRDGGGSELGGCALRTSPRFYSSPARRSPVSGVR